jgi:glutamyl-Q tRNA(Asp) synthetase
MEDLDTPRSMPGAADAILQTLEAFSFEWHGNVIYQSQRAISEKMPAYATALENLQGNGLVYPCSCSRREIADSAAHGINGLVYPGTCRAGALKNQQQYALRIKVEDGLIDFEDAIQGHISQDLGRDIGDFVLKRADGIFAYQLAVVVDDAEQGITHVVRGADLLDSTPRQIYLQHKLGMATPDYAHIPLAANTQGEKLSKQTLARPLDASRPVSALWQALDFLGQQPAVELQEMDLETLWDWAKAHWQLEKVQRQRLIQVPGI